MEKYYVHVGFHMEGDNVVWEEMDNFSSAFEYAEKNPAIKKITFLLATGESIKLARRETAWYSDDKNAFECIWVVDKISPSEVKGVL